jgi:hypothetical protein
MTYDNAKEVRALAARHSFDTILVPMKPTHHERKTELLIGRNLDSARRSRQLRLDIGYLQADAPFELAQR